MQTTRRRPTSGLDAGARRDAIATLRILFAPGGERALFTLAPGKTRIGRAGEIAIGDTSASRVHAEVEWLPAETRARIADANSANGTHLNGARVENGALEDGDLVRVGDSFFIFRLLTEEPEDADIPEVVGVSPSMMRLRARIGRLAGESATVLLRGETGTGKEVVANAIHRLSGRTGQRVSVNCSAIPADLAESQLFGHAAGAFTGARAHAGFFRAADKGTLFLDEIAELPLSLQPKLLRALEERSVTPVGSTEPVPVDVRLVAATHNDLARAIFAGRFRADLYARLADLVLELPKLAARTEDVLLLLEHAGVQVAKLQPDIIEKLLLYPWPLNVREVFKLANHLRVFGADDAFLARLSPPGTASAAADPALTPAVTPAPKRGALEKPSKEALVALLEKHEGVVKDVADELGCSRRQVGRWIDELGIDRGLFRG